MVSLDSRFGPVTPQQINELEMHLDISLPDDYKKFLLEWNGGKPTPDRFSIPGWSNKSSVVNRFLAVHAGKHSNLQKKIEVYEDRLPRELIPIAEDPFGNLICLGLGGNRLGRIYFWDHEDELDDEGLSRLDFSNVYELAESLKQFTDSLRPRAD